MRASKESMRSTVSTEGFCFMDGMDRMVIVDGNNE
jgi:hypothetical protein